MSIQPSLVTEHDFLVRVSAGRPAPARSMGPPGTVCCRLAMCCVSHRMWLTAARASRTRRRRWGRRAAGRLTGVAGSRMPPIRCRSACVAGPASP